MGDSIGAVVKEMKDSWEHDSSPLEKMAGWIDRLDDLESGLEAAYRELSQEVEGLLKDVGQ